MAGVGALMFGVMMMVTVIDVGGRYFFLRPLDGATELIGLMLIIGGTWGIGYCQLHKMHIRIGVFMEMFPKILQRLIWVFTFVISLAVSGAISWQAYLRTEAYIAASLGDRTDVLGIPFWPLMLCMAIGFTWGAVIFLIVFGKSVKEVFRP